MSHLERSLKKIDILFKFSGITYQSSKLNRKEILKIRSIYLLNFFWLNSGVLGAIYWFIDGIISGKTFLELTYVAPCFVYSIMSNARPLFLIHYERLVCNLIDDLRELDASENETDEEVKIKKAEIDFLHTLMKISKILYVALFITFNLSSPIMIALTYMNTKEVKLVLQFMIKYPFDAYDIKYWPFVYVHQFWAVGVVLLYLIASDSLLYVCCGYLRIQFRLLQHEFENIVKSEEMLLDNDLKLLKEKFVHLIKWHQELIRLASLLELIYSKSILVNFVCSSIIICLTGFNVMAIENVVFAVSFLVFLSASLSQIFFLCFFGDLLMESSTEVSNAVYNCKWYYLDTRTAKNILIVLTRAQKPCKLTAYGFSDVNFRSFMSILSTSWSYFALLKTVYVPPQN